MPFLYINTPAKVNILRNFGKIMHLSLDFFFQRVYNNNQQRYESICTA